MASLDAPAAAPREGGFVLGGRRPAGFAASLSKAREPGDYFARLAEAEEASVTAFRALAADLASLGAPGALVRAARRAARDEERHAQVTAALARRFDATVSSADVPPQVERGLEALAIDNVIEGCVRETYAAEVLASQVERAEDAVVRAALRTVADDERTHARLAWDVAAWVEPQLDAAATKRYVDAARSGIKEVRAEAYAAYPEALRKIAGLLSVRDALALIDGLDRTTWRPRITARG